MSVGGSTSVRARLHGLTAHAPRGCLHQSSRECNSFPRFREAAIGGETCRASKHRFATSNAARDVRARIGFVQPDASGSYSGASQLWFTAIAHPP
jgi:hypothetical protein